MFNFDIVYNIGVFGCIFKIFTLILGHQSTIIAVILVVLIVCMGVIVGGICIQKRIYHIKRQRETQPPSFFNNPINFNDNTTL